MTSAATTAFPWPLVAKLCWGNELRPAWEQPYIREMRSRIIADLIALKRRARRRTHRLIALWLRDHPDTHDFLLWLDAYHSGLPGCEQAAIGPLLDEYLARLWGEAR